MARKAALREVIIMHGRIFFHMQGGEEGKERGDGGAEKEKNKKTKTKMNRITLLRDTKRNLISAQIRRFDENQSTYVCSPDRAWSQACIGTGIGISVHATCMYAVAGKGSYVLVRCC